MLNEIYLDNNRTTRPSDRAVAKMIPFLTERWGVPSAPHGRGQQLNPAIEEALRSIYALMRAKEEDDVIFTSGSAESINHVIFSTYFDVTVHTGKNQFITSAVDEAPSIMAIGRLEQLSCLGKMVAPDKHGRITADAIAEAMTPRTALVSLSWANGLTGVINPIEEIAALCKERGARGDAIHAPAGTGCLIIRHGTRASPFILGGVEQGGYRAGGYSVAALAALGEAAREAADACDLMCTEVARLRGRLEAEVIAPSASGTGVFSGV
jgi:cysteine desulfurase